jgi:hypothetical protein
VTQTLSRGTTTIWSMSTSVLIDGTTQPVEIICDSVELTRDKRDNRLQIESLLRDSPINPREINDIEQEIGDVKNRIYEAALSSDDERVSTVASYARGLEERLEQEQDYVYARKLERLNAIRQAITRRPVWDQRRRRRCGRVFRIRPPPQLDR